ncbi:MAG: HIT family hydrolase, partial [Actinomycetota bacterium]
MNDSNQEIAGVGIPDRWQRLWAPHRMAYLKGENRPLSGNEVTCPFCEIPEKRDEEGLVVARAEYNYVVLNL